MKTAYIRDRLSRPLKDPERRQNALKAIETMLQNESPNLLKDPEAFKKINQDDFKNMYSSRKEKPLRSAEKSVINGLYKFAKL